MQSMSVYFDLKVHLLFKYENFDIILEYPVKLRKWDSGLKYLKEIELTE